MWKASDTIEAAPDGRSQVLDRLAAALGGSADSIFGTSAQASESTEAYELLSLWMSLRTDQARARVLANLRAAVAAQSD